MEFWKVNGQNEAFAKSMICTEIITDNILQHPSQGAKKFVEQIFISVGPGVLESGEDGGRVRQWRLVVVGPRRRRHF